ALRPPLARGARLLHSPALAVYRGVTPVPALQWARLNADLNLRLRRGAWYRVLELHPLEAVLDVRGARVTVPRPFLEIVGTPPRRWTVVAGLRDASHAPPPRGGRTAVGPRRVAAPPPAPRRPVPGCAEVPSPPATGVIRTITTPWAGTGAMKRAGNVPRSA